ncbi:hypothetical protein NP233_g7847 [Leucocoprinus birnbaumii]|uniref:Uncharacterized protein n=1 Tax=Leucocoprinus birnbaumii TaxID=56174 RepID=A0AAD5VR44_9AGAR|nr:hypothetical protein NP233_g7847 [Leucocoprinus birnbaumii]
MPESIPTPEAYSTDSATHNFPEPADFKSFYQRLPGKARKEVFLHAYYADEKAACQLTLVSQEVRDWHVSTLDPLIHASIILPMDFTSDSSAYLRLKMYERTFRVRSSTLFYENNVKRIYTNNKHRGKSSDFELKLLPLCKNLESLECWSDRREELSIVLRTNRWENLTTLAINIDLFPRDEPTFLFPIFEQVTHLDIRSDYGNLPCWKSLKSLVKLTHMRVNLIQEGISRPKAMNRILDIATEAKSHIPAGMKSFIILIPAYMFCRISMTRMAIVDGRRRTIESIQSGGFDHRMILGCAGDYDRTMVENIWTFSRSDPHGFMGTFGWYSIMVMLKYPCHPRNYRDSEEEEDSWARVPEIFRKREGLGLLGYRVREK